jgi:hypothetical protein
MCRLYRTHDDVSVTNWVLPPFFAGKRAPTVDVRTAIRQYGNTAIRQYGNTAIRQYGITPIRQKRRDFVGFGAVVVAGRVIH